METYSSWSSFLKYNTMQNVVGQGPEMSDVNFQLNPTNTSSIFQFNEELKQNNTSTTLYELSKSLLNPYYTFKYQENSETKNLDQCLVVFGQNVSINNLELSKDEKPIILNCENTMKSMHCLLLSNIDIPFINLSNVTQINNFATYWGTHTRIDAYQLEKAINIEMCYNTLLKTINLPKLNYCTYLYFSYLPEVTAIQLGIVECKSLYLTDCKLLFTQDFEYLEKAKSVYITDNQTLSNIVLPKLKQAKKLVLTNNNSVKSINLNSLYQCKTIFICNNPTLEHIHLNNLKECSTLVIKNCPKLKSINLNELQTVYKLLILTGNNYTEYSYNKLTHVNKGYIFNPFNMSCLPLNINTKMLFVDGPTKCLHTNM